jgi:macrolide transport system ATP-binding/permease protein
MTDRPVIEIDGLTKTYGSAAGSVHALRGVSLSIGAGEFVAIMGSSGSGKTTLMNILGCLDRPTSGRFMFEGRNVAAMQPDDVARLRRDSFGFIFQSYNLIATATALENVEVPAVYAGLTAADRRARAARLLTSLGLGDRLDHRPNQLSGGQQQRVAVARALMNGGRVLFADEPTGALDTASGAEVMALLRQLNEDGHTIVLITHDAEVAAYADRIVTMSDGAITSDSGPERRGAAGLPAEAGKRAPKINSRLPFTEITESIRMATHALGVNLFRTTLTLLGIVIGVGSVIAMLAVGNGAKQTVIDRISALGTNLLLVRPGSPEMRGVGGRVTTLVPTDAAALSALPNVVAAVAEMTGTVTIRFSNADYQTEVNGTTQDFPVVKDWPLAAGTFIDDADVETYATVAVLGQTVVENVFPADVDPIGRYVQIGNTLFQVIGVMAEKGATPWGSDQDDVIFVPISTSGLRLFGQRHVRSITVLVDDFAKMAATEQIVTETLTRRHRAQDFRVRNMATVVAAATETQNTLTVLLGSIAAISLLVGGIGVMNIMLVSVSERTREIGIRMATGARAMNIMQQFMTEAVTVSVIGGLAGMVAGLGVAWALQQGGMPVVFSATPVVLAFGCACLTGIVFGFAPARKAAHLDPVVALGAE